MKLSNFKLTHYLLAIGLFIIGEASNAHEQSVAKLSLSVDTSHSSLRWQIRMIDLTRVISLDDDLDGNIQWREIIANQQKLSKFLNQNIQIGTSKNYCQLILDDIDMLETTIGTSIILNSKLACLGKIETLDYSFLDNLDSLHVAYLNYQQGSTEFEMVIRNEQRKVIFDNIETNQFNLFIYQGFFHILIGTDHLAFLLILFFLAQRVSFSSCQYSSDYLCLSKSTRDMLKNLLGFISTFTIAHTITLLSASLGLISLASWFVESIIAASVAWGAWSVISGQNNINTPTVFGIGLIHGLGFASVLSDLSSDATSNLIQLVGFNLGVEIGQIVFLLIAIVFMFLPSRVFGQLKVGKIVSLPILLLASIWIIERVIHIEII